MQNEKQPIRVIEEKNIRVQCIFFCPNDECKSAFFTRVHGINATA
jgi:hypothetical protein